jgi:Kef-type K+ transport system membrane component KefB
MPCLILAAEAPDTARVLWAVLLVFASAKLLSEVFERLGQPGIVGEILAGVLIGPQVLGLMQPNDVLTILSDLGVMFLLFRVGLDVKASELMRVGGTALLVAVAGVILPLFLGTGVALLFHQPRLESIFIGAAMVATSVGITAQVLAARGLLQTRAAQIILAAAVVDDVLGLIVLALISGLARGSVNYLELALTGAMALGFTFLLARFGTRTVGRVMPRLRDRLSLSEAEFALAMTLLFSLSLLAVYVGVAAIVGAFLAGLALSESTDERVVEMTSGVSELLVPFFLAGIGLRLDISALRSPPTILLSLVIILVALASKFTACGAAALRIGRTDAVRVGVGMIPRGEVGMVVAQIGTSMGIMNQGAYDVIVLMSMATTLVAPPLLKVAFRAEAARADAKEMSRIG